MFYATQPGGFYGGGLGNQGALTPIDASRFILNDLRTGVAGNPFGSDFVIPGKKPAGQPVLPGENKRQIEEVYGTPGPKPMPGSAPLGLPMAFGSSNLPTAIGNMAGIVSNDLKNNPNLNQDPRYLELFQQKLQEMEEQERTRPYFRTSYPNKFA